MKITYQFATESVEIDVSEEWANVIIDLDRQEYNNEHAETRRHCSIEEYDSYSNLISADADIEKEIIEKNYLKQLPDAIQSLCPRQQHLIKEVFFNGRQYADIAKEEGLNRATVYRTTMAAIKNLEKFFESGDNNRRSRGLPVKGLQNMPFRKDGTNQ